MGHLPRTLQELLEAIFAGQLKVMSQVENDCVLIDFTESTFKAMERAGAYFFVLKPTWKVSPALPSQQCSRTLPWVHALVYLHLVLQAQLLATMFTSISCISGAAHIAQPVDSYCPIMTHCSLMQSSPYCQPDHLTGLLAHRLHGSCCNAIKSCMRRMVQG